MVDKHAWMLRYPEPDHFKEASKIGMHYTIPLTGRGVATHTMRRLSSNQHLLFTAAY